MKKIFVCFSIVSFFLFSSSAWAITISFDPSDSFINLGDSVGIDINISGLENTNIGAFDFNIEYDNTILSFDSYEFGNQLGNLLFFEALDVSAGGDNLAETSFLFDLSFQADAFTLATLSFTGIGEGKSPLSLSGILSDDTLFPAAISLDYELEVSSVTCDPVPEPSTIFLFGIGLIGITMFMKKRHFSR